MRSARSALVLCALAAALPARAQQRDPSVHALALPLQLSGALDRHAQHSCSQSFAGSHGLARTSLVIDASGAARLSLEGSEDSTFGPSPGRYAAGDHDFTTTHTLHRSSWSGRAVLAGGRLTIAFTGVEAAEVRFTGTGALPLPAPTTAPFAGQLECAIERIDLLPSAATEHETATPTDLARCTWAGSAPVPFEHYTDGASWALGAGAGVVSTSEDEPWGSITTHAVRRAP